MAEIVQSIKDTANSAMESVAGTGAEASKEANKSVAKDSNASIGTRAGAAKDAAGDFMDQKKHEGKSEAYSAKS